MWGGGRAEEADVLNVCAKRTTQISMSTLIQIGAGPVKRRMIQQQIPNHHQKAAQVTIKIIMPKDRSFTHDIKILVTQTPY